MIGLYLGSETVASLATRFLRATGENGPRTTPRATANADGETAAVPPIGSSYR